ncbi:uncharacterized protein SPSC_04152 [Sporisorium scitamineum]|uniref:Uncharacterized protein n=1 Tax=Sporisorium scitamineum TaxID=49012 RepID=A0A0F7RT57_9BASI|nr:uncharacterized protein SPSC_04152 [Sporisorium scitamineum]CDR99525.1 hypothetical protein [Sporisorium scitamineum]
MVETSRFSDSDSVADEFEAMNIESDVETPSSGSDSLPDHFLRARICDHFIQYYRNIYSRRFTDRCVQSTTDPWDGITCNRDRIDELFHRITCFVDDILDNSDYNDVDPDRRFYIIKESLSDWMDVLVQRSHHELKIAGHGGRCIIFNDPWSGTYSLYKRLDDWVQQTVLERALTDRSTVSGSRQSPDADDGHEDIDAAAGSGYSSDSFHNFSD